MRERGRTIVVQGGVYERGGDHSGTRGRLNRTTFTLCTVKKESKKNFRFEKNQQPGKPGVYETFI